MRCLAAVISFLLLPIVFGSAHAQIDSARARQVADTTAWRHYVALATTYLAPTDQMQQPYYDSAAFYYEKAIACDSTRVVAYVNAAACYLQLKNFARAKQFLMRASELNGDLVPGQIARVRRLVAVGSADSAIDQCQVLLQMVEADTGKIRRSEKEEAYRVTSQTYFQMKRYDLAIIAAQNASAAGFVNAQLQLLWGQSLLQLLDAKKTAEENRTNINESVKHLRRAVQLDPRNAQAHLWLGTALTISRSETGNDQRTREEACKEFRLTLRLDPGNKDALRSMERLGCK